MGWRRLQCRVELLIFQRGSMSQRIVTAVFDAYQPSSKPEYLLALFLATQADDKGLGVMPSVGSLALNIRTSERTVKRAIETMRSSKWLAWSPGDVHFRVSPAWLISNAR